MIVDQVHCEHDFFRISTNVLTTTFQCRWCELLRPIPTDQLDNKDKLLYPSNDPPMITKEK